MIGVTRVSSRGQVVILKPIRESLNLTKGDRLIAYARGTPDTGERIHLHLFLVTFKRVHTPSLYGEG